jgi:hypothetical protein
LPKDKADEAFMRLGELKIESAIIGRITKDSIYDEDSVKLDAHEELWNILRK